MGTIIQRFAADDAGSAESRKPLAALAWSMIEDHPYGVGLNNYGEVMFNSRYIPPSLIGSRSIYTVHNKYLLVWAETGPWGMVVFILLILAGLSTTVRLIFNKNAPPHLVTLSLALFASLVGYAQNMISESFATRQRAQFLWLLLALLVGVYKLTVAESQNERAVVGRQPASYTRSAQLNAPLS
jgi:O-antigen ligase